MIRKLCLTLILLVAPLSAHSELYSMEGDKYSQTENENGIVLTSEFVKYRIVGTGAQAEVVEKHEIFFLGRSCDAFNSRLGEGRWYLTNSGVVIEFNDGSEFTFRFELVTTNDDLLRCTN